MGQNGHVPKYGNWDTEDEVPYTQLFDNARIAKVGGKPINPNDPYDNPDVFKNSSQLPLQTTKKKADLEVAPKAEVGRNKYMDDDAIHPQVAGGAGKPAARPDGRFPQPLKAPNEPMHGAATNVPNRSKMRPGGRGVTDEADDDSSVVPPFGAWDQDPSFADGYTDIFDNLRKERQTNSSKVPVISHDPSFTDDHKQKKRLKFKCCGCFNWG